MTLFEVELYNILPKYAITSTWRNLLRKKKNHFAQRYYLRSWFLSMGEDNNNKLLSESLSLHTHKTLSWLSPASHVGESSGRTSRGGHTGHHPGPEPGSVLLRAGEQRGGGGCAVHPAGAGIHHCGTVRETPPLLNPGPHTHMDPVCTQSYCTDANKPVQSQFPSHTINVRAQNSLWISPSPVMPHQVVGLCVCGGGGLHRSQSQRKETVFVPPLWGCRHSCNWNALHVADWRDNLLAMCFSHSHVMRLGSGCRVLIYILVKKEKKEKRKAHASRKLENSFDVRIEGLGRDDSLGVFIVSENAEFPHAFGRAIHLLRTVP